MTFLSLSITEWFGKMFKVKELINQVTRKTSITLYDRNKRIIFYPERFARHIFIQLVSTCISQSAMSLSAHHAHRGCF